MLDGVELPRSQPYGYDPSERLVPRRGAASSSRYATPEKYVQQVQVRAGGKGVTFHIAGDVNPVAKRSLPFVRVTSSELQKGRVVGLTEQEVMDVKRNRFYNGFLTDKEVGPWKSSVVVSPAPYPSYCVPL